MFPFLEQPRKHFGAHLQYKLLKVERCGCHLSGMLSASAADQSSVQSRAQLDCLNEKELH